MNARLPRRRFLGATAALGLGAALGTTPRRAFAATPVPLRPEIEPVARWIEDTPRERILDVAIEQLRNGLPDRDLMAGLFLAAIRNIKPRPVGFKFHAVMVVNSTHVLSQSVSGRDRRLPLLWALDNFKGSQAQDVKEGDWMLEAVGETPLPRPSEARAAFASAMERWDDGDADAAAVALARSAGAAEVMESFWRYAVRDSRNIGHKPIFAMQSWRTLQAIGWRHAEPVFRSLAFGLLDRQGDGNRAPEGPYAANLERAKSIRPDWAVGKADPSSTASLLDALRHASADDASAEVAKSLNAGIDPGSLWDAIVMAGSEILLQAPGIVPLHAVTSSNALHYIFTESADDTTRKLALLQAAGWFPAFRDRTNAKSAFRIDAIEPKGDRPEKSSDAIHQAFVTAGRDRAAAATEVVGYIRSGGDPREVFAEARRMILMKARDSHEYKFGAAAWEECLLATDPEKRPAMTAAALGHVPSADTPDNPLMVRAREALKDVPA